MTVTLVASRDVSAIAFVDEVAVAIDLEPPFAVVPSALGHGSSPGVSRGDAAGRLNKRNAEAAGQAPKSPIALMATLS
jgi:hypothetical protein